MIILIIDLLGLFVVVVGALVVVVVVLTGECGEEHLPIQRDPCVVLTVLPGGGVLTAGFTWEPTG